MKLTLDTYIISDTHFGHKNIIKYCARPENHDEIMWNNWVDTISKDDTILHLGDIAFKNNFIPLNELPGNKYLIKGNHDHKTDTYYENFGFTVLPKRQWFEYKGKQILLTHFPEDNFDIGWDINIHGHIHNNSYITREDKGRLYINVSIEVMNYTPAKLGTILKEV